MYNTFDVPLYPVYIMNNTCMQFLLDNLFKVVEPIVCKVICYDLDYQYALPLALLCKKYYKNLMPDFLQHKYNLINYKFPLLNNSSQVDLLKNTLDLKILQKHSLFHDDTQINSLIHTNQHVVHDILSNMLRNKNNIPDKEFVMLADFYHFEEYQTMAAWRCEGIMMASFQTAYLMLISPLLCVCCPCVLMHDFVNFIEDDDFENSLCAPYYVCNKNNKGTHYQLRCYPCYPKPLFCCCYKL